jgi:YVTN family beta-propeller protein
MKTKKVLLVSLPICLISFFSMTCGEFYDFDHDNPNDPEYPRGAITGIARLQWEDDHSGIKVSLSEPGYATTTNLLGVFEITGIPAGKSYALIASKEGFNDATSSVAVSANQETDLGDIILQSEFGRIAGVVKKEGADLHYGINVAILDDLSINAITYIDGSYVISDVPPGPHIIYASAPPPYYPAESPVPVDVIPGITVTADELELPAAPLSPIVENAYPVNSSAIAVVWQPNTEEDLKGYYVYYQTKNEASECPESYIRVNDDPIPSTEQFFVVNGLSKGHVYSFKVTAVDQTPMVVDGITGLQSPCSKKELYQFIFPLPGPQPSLEMAGQIDQASGLAISEDGTKLFVTANFEGDGVVYVYDIDTNYPSIIAAPTVSSDPIRIAINPDPAINEAYVIHLLSTAISIISTTNYQLIGTQDMFYEMQDIVVAPPELGGYIYAIEPSDAFCFRVIERLGPGSLSDHGDSCNVFFPDVPTSLAIAKDKIFVTVDLLFSNGYVSVIDPNNSHEEADTITVGAQPGGIAASTDEKYLYVTNSLDRNVSIINLGGPTTYEESKVDVGIYPEGIGASENLIYIINSLENYISMISTITNEVLSCNIPYGCPFSIDFYAQKVVITPDGNKIFVSVPYARNVRIFNYTYNITP